MLLRATRVQVRRKFRGKLRGVSRKVPRSFCVDFRTLSSYGGLRVEGSGFRVLGFRGFVNSGFGILRGYSGLRALLLLTFLG